MPTQVTLKDALARIAELINSDIPEPVSRAASDLKNYLTGVLSKVRDERAEMVSTRQHMVSACEREQIDEGYRYEMRRTLDETQEEYGRALIAFADREKSVLSKIQRLNEDPLSMFLPLGTIVQFTDVGCFNASLTGRDVGKSYPAPGTVGVVTRLNHNSERSIGISIGRPFDDGAISHYEVKASSFPTYMADPEQLKVIGNGRLPGNRQCAEYGFVPTHMVGENLEMIIEADGLLWRIHDFGAAQGVAALSTITNMSEMPDTTISITDEADNVPLETVLNPVEVNGVEVDFLHGHCEYLALAINELSGHPISAYIDEAAAHDDNVDGPVLIHAFVLHNGVAYDARGQIEPDRLLDCFDYWDAELFEMSPLKLCRFLKVDLNEIKRTQIYAHALQLASSILKLPKPTVSPPSFCS
ncbi:hypothetical protein ACFOY8_12730 [Thalassospira xianhensis]|uniref:Uncharacterized protein n=1 Tax=Thalassospira xianhensis MCCC 1A02616 TaxID=1177929 RepID=A0A367UD95_9PROT|nr:hypothetical protein [Thalassospira xianhensis]RCK06285.1 hypothetical protein TH5_08705 [Thalassospira xianhensis MCCC 1A02616]